EPVGIAESGFIVAGIVADVVPIEGRMFERRELHRHECVLSAGEEVLCSCNQALGSAATTLLSRKKSDLKMAPRTAQQPTPRESDIARPTANASTARFPGRGRGNASANAG